MGYARNHSVGTHRMYNPATKQIIIYRDVTFRDNSRNNKKVTPDSKLDRHGEREYDSNSDDKYGNIPALIRRKRRD